MAYEREIGELRAKMKKMKQDLKLSVRQSAERYGEGTVLKREAQLLRECDRLQAEVHRLFTTCCKYNLLFIQPSTFGPDLT